MDQTENRFYREPPTTEIRKTATDWRVCRSDGTIVNGFVSEDEARGYAYGRGWPLVGWQVLEPSDAERVERPDTPSAYVDGIDAAAAAAGDQCEELVREWERERLRDDFACAALKGLLACPTVTDGPGTIVRAAWAYADAMLAAREQRS